MRARGAGASPGPFERHVREAIELNAHRRGLYARASGGASLRVSRRLIWSERLLLPAARWFDGRAEPWHRAGVPLLEELFVSMERTPAFRAAEPPPPEARPVLPAAAPIRERVLAAARRGGFAAAAEVLEREIEALAAPCYDCMLRHLLESAHRLCLLAPRMARLSAERGLPPPDALLERLLRVHAWGVGAAARLDRAAFPLQRRGLPILCRDLPPIPRPADPTGRPV